MKSARIPLTVMATVLLGSALASAQTYYDDTHPRIDAPQRSYQDPRYPSRDVSAPPDVRARDLETRGVLTSSDIAAVEKRRDQVLSRDMVGRKLGAADYQELRRQRHEVDQLIAQMRAGETVSSEQVDRALGLYDQSRPGY